MPSSGGGCYLPSLGKPKFVFVGRAVSGRKARTRLDEFDLGWSPTMPARDHFRAHARYRVDLEGRLRVGESGSYGVRLRDLGLGGACVELVEVAPSAALDVEGPIALEVTAPSLWDP